jgi:hypothetical protein
MRLAVEQEESLFIVPEQILATGRIAHPVARRTQCRWQSGPGCGHSSAERDDDLRGRYFQRRRTFRTFSNDTMKQIEDW